MPGLMDADCRIAIEKCVSEYAGRKWAVADVVPNTVGAMHEAALFKGDGLDVYVKMGTNPFSFDQFTQEAWGLSYIRSHSPIKTPEVIGVVKTGEKVLLIMEAIRTKPAETKKDWQILGSGLAELHKTTWDRCGLQTHSYLGIFLQDNTPEATWAEFFGERRLRPGLKMAIESGNMTSEATGAVEKLIEKLPSLCDKTQPFSLLHGDPWLGNLLYDGKQLVLIDCSIYYGNREIDLSTVDLFCEVSPDFFEAYHEAYPIEPGYVERKSLWRVNQWLGIVTLLGKSEIPKLMDAVKPYL